MSKIRDLSRLARRIPAVRGAIEAGDPRRRAERLAKSGIVDPRLYALQLGVETISVEDAALHYATEGYLLGYTLNVLTDPFVIRRGMIRTDRPALYDYFNSKAWHVRTTGVWSVSRYVAEYPDAVEHPLGPVGHIWERVTRDPQTKIVIDAGGERETTWSKIYPVLLDATAEWAELERDRRARYPRPNLDHPGSERVQDGDSGTHRVSIIMPVWNRGGGMRRAVEAIIAQTWQDWELLVIDDGSWDDTVAVAELLAGRDSRIRLLTQDHRGVCAARNAGIAQATGEFVAFLDSDNTWRPEFLYDMVTTMVRDGLTTAYATIALDNGESVRYRSGSPTMTSLLRGNSIDLNTLVTRREAVEQVGAFDPTLRRAVDYDLILKLAALAPIVHVPTLGAVYDNDENATDRISTTEAVGWNTAVRLRHALDTGATSYAPNKVVSLLQRHDPALATKLSILAGLDEDTAASIVGVGVKPDEWRQIRACVFDRAHMRATLHQSGEPYAYVVDIELKHSKNQVIAVIDPRSIFTADGLRSLVDEVVSGRADAVIPLTVASDGTIESIGSMMAEPRLPIDILTGHPVEDAIRLGDRVKIPGLSGRTFAIRRLILDKARGLDPLLHNEYELSGITDSLDGRNLIARTDVRFTQIAPPLEFIETDPNGTLPTLRARLSNAQKIDPETVYSKLGMSVAHWRMRSADVIADDALAPAFPRERLVAVMVRDRTSVTVDGLEVPRLRWAIKTAAPAGPSGASWGDTHFARSLAASLNRLGQEAVVDFREARHRETEYLDDVVIHLRGLDEFAPSPAPLSYLWVISHPDMVTRRESLRFDRVFAASVKWASAATERWSIPVQPLLQCTDSSKFRPAESEIRDGILFVGNSRGIPRATVMESVKAGLPIELYGGDWERFIPAESITGTKIDNDELGQRYAGAAVVLNDHWSDMKREGFISNRLFDVVAAGGRAYSDDVPDVGNIFQGAVRTYKTVSEIAPFLRGDLDSHFPDEETLRTISERIRTEHSFDARARVLLDHAIADQKNRRG